MPNSNLDERLDDPGAGDLEAAMRRTSQAMRGGSLPVGDRAWPAVHKAIHRRRTRGRALTVAAVVVIAAGGAALAWPGGSATQVTTASPAAPPSPVTVAPGDSTTTSLATTTLPPVTEPSVPVTVPPPVAPGVHDLSAGGWTFTVPAGWTVHDLTMDCSGFVEGWFIGPATAHGDPVTGVCLAGPRTAQIGIGVATFADGLPAPQVEGEGDGADGGAAPGVISTAPVDGGTQVVWSESTEATSALDRAALAAATASAVAPAG